MCKSQYFYFLLVSLMMQNFIQVLFHPLPPSTAACWPLREPAEWWHRVCSEGERDPFSSVQQRPSLCLFHRPPPWHLSLSPLHHLDVEAETFVNWIGFPSDTRAQPKHLWWAVHHAVLSTESCVCQIPSICLKDFQRKLAFDTVTW